MIALSLLRAIAALFIIMALGFLIVKLRLLKSADSRVLSVVSIYILCPCMIVKSFQIEFTPQVRSGFLLALGAAVGVNFLLMGVTKLYAKALGFDSVERASVMYANTGNLVLPLVSTVLGEEYVIYASAFMCVQMVFIWVHANSLIGGVKGFSLKKILTNVNIIAIAVGIALLLSGIALPGLVTDVMGQLSAVMGPAAMLMIGMLLAGVDWKQVLRSRRSYLVVALKMVVTPLLVLAALKLSGLQKLVPDGKTVLYISFMAVITPCASFVTQLAQIHRNRPEYASALNVMTTLACIGTMPLMTWLYMLVM